MKQEVKPVPLSGPYLGEREEELVLEVMRSGRLSLGPTIDRFEELLAERVGAPYAAAVSSGTAGLHLLCDHRGHRPRRRGDHVSVLLRGVARTASSTRAASRSSPTSTRARSTSTRPPSRRRSRSRRRRSSLSTSMAVPCELDELRAIADRHGLALIGDSCEALGAEYKGAPLGSHGVPCVFAFYPNKQMTTGEGGWSRRTRRRSGASSARSATRVGRSPGGWLEHVRLGFNYRLERHRRRARDRPARAPRRDPRASRTGREPL